MDVTPTHIRKATNFLYHLHKRHGRYIPRKDGHFAKCLGAPHCPICLEEATQWVVYQEVDGELFFRQEKWSTTVVPWLRGAWTGTGEEAKGLARLYNEAYVDEYPMQADCLLHLKQRYGHVWPTE